MNAQVRPPGPPDGIAPARLAASADVGRERPRAPVPDMGGIPDELKAVPQWLLWSYEQREGKWTKRPRQPSGMGASSTDSRTWSTLAIAASALERGSFDGLGFVASKDDPYVLIDVDHVVTPEGEIEDWAEEIITAGEREQAYIEWSPSKTGFHIIGRGEQRSSGAKRNRAELYTSGRFFTMTGDAFFKPTGPLGELRKTVELVLARIDADEGKEPAAAPVAVPVARHSDSQLLERARRAANGGKFSALFDQGDSSAYDSPSEADAALAMMLAFWTGKDETAVERLMLQSALKRDKWGTRRGESSYLRQTIANAVSKCHETYQPREPREFSAGAEHAHLHGAANSPAAAKALAPVIHLRPLAEIVAERRAPAWIGNLRDVLEARVVAVLAGPRGSFKSFVALHWAMRAALAGHGVAILSGEGAGLSQRAAAWMQEHGRGHRLESLRVVAYERPASLNQAEVRAAVVAALQSVAWPVELLLIDTLSKYSAGLDENNNPEMAAFLSSLAVDIRDELGATVLLVAHSGHADAGRPRGAYVLMATPDAEYIVKRDPGSMAFSVSRERFKDTPSLPPLGYMARSVDLGYTDDIGQPVTSLVLDDTDAPAVPAKAKGLGKNQERALAALAEWVRSHPDRDFIDSEQLRGLLGAQGIKSRARRFDATKFLVASGALVPAVAGFTVRREHIK